MQHNSPYYRILHFNSYFPPLYGDVIIIPENTIFYRGYSKQYPVLSDRPAYFSNKDIATKYVRTPDAELGIFTNSKPLRLLDYRFMKVILKQFFDEVTKTTIFAKEESKVIASVLLSFGITSLSHQILLLDNFPLAYIQYDTGFQRLKGLYKGPSLIEKPGIRVGETTNDAISMGFLKGLLEHQFDGFVSPQLDTVFHGEKNDVLPPEMILLNPLACGIQQLHSVPKSILSINLLDLAHKDHTNVTLVVKDVATEFYMKGGSKKFKLHSLDDIDLNINAKNKVIIHNYNLGLKIGTKWQRNHTNILYTIGKPPPHIKGIDLLAREDGPLKII